MLRRPERTGFATSSWRCSMEKRRAEPRASAPLRWVVSGLALALLSLWVPLGLSASTTAPASPPANTQPPRVLGKAQEGQLVFADLGRWRAARQTAFQWRVCSSGGDPCADVPGATDSIYAIGTVDVGKTLRVLVSAANRSGTSSVLSAPTDLVVAAPADAPRSTRPPAVTGTPQDGQLLAVDAGTWSAPAPVRLSYRWRLCDGKGGSCGFNGATGKFYRPRSREVGHTFRVLVQAQGGPLASYA